MGTDGLGEGYTGEGDEGDGGDGGYRSQVLERRRKMLYALLLLASVSVLLVYLLILFTDIGTNLPVDNLERLRNTAAMSLLSAAAAYGVARRGAVRGAVHAAAYLFLGVALLTATVLDEPQQVIGGRSMISFPILIVAAGLVLPPAATFVFAAASTLAVAALATLYSQHYVQVASDAIVFFLTAGLTWFFASRLERANSDLARSGAALRTLNVELEERVELRTAELRRANAELAQSSRLKDEFLATMSHELRTPLTSVLTVAEVLEAGVYEPLTPLQKQKVQQIHANGSRLLSLIEQVLDYAQLQAGELTLSRHPVRVANLCQAAVGAVAVSAAAKGQALRWLSELDTDACIEVDAQYFQHVLVALLDNAVKFTPNGGEVGLDVLAGAQAGNPGGSIEFVVWDTGIGIAAEHLEDLFHPFHQVDNSLSRSYEGAGLSLALAQRVTALHGGDICVTSAPGQGSRFTVVLPLPV